MHRIAFTLAVVFLSVAALTAQAQESGPVSPSVPAASLTQAACTGFIAKSSVPHDAFVIGGGDDDFHSVVHQFVQGDSIFISPHHGADIAVGAEFSVVRPANELFRTSHYQHERRDIGKLGRPYEDVAHVVVTHVNPHGAVAKVTLSCGPIVPGDTLVPFQPRAIPQYTVSKPVDHFAPLDRSRQHGRITASRNNYGFLGRETVVYLNLGEKAGVTPGERFRIYKVIPARKEVFLTSHRTPPETVGEVVVLSVQARSSAAMVVSSYREISAGDYVEVE